MRDVRYVGPYWSPDGARIGFTLEPNPRPTCEIKSTELAVVNVDGTECRRLTENAWNDLFCGWSADGTAILFTSSQTGRSEIWVMNSDLSNIRCLTDDAATDSMAAWSPDGRRIAFVSDRDGNDEIYVMDREGSSVTRITSDPAHDWMPAWSADGTEIVFSSDRGGTLDVFAVALTDLSVRRLTSDPGYDYEAVWLGELGLERDGFDGCHFGETLRKNLVVMLGDRLGPQRWAVGTSVAVRCEDDPISEPVSPSHGCVDTPRR